MSLQTDFSTILQQPIFQALKKTVADRNIEAYIIGGFVRDHLLQRNFKKDIDIVVIGSGIDLAKAVHQELGRGLVSEPAISSAVIAVTLLANSENQVLKQRWLTAHAEGDAVLAVAWQEQGERDSQRPLCTRATASNGGYTLEGRKILVWHGAGAQAVIVSALLDGAVALFLMPADTAGVSVQDYPTFDGARSATINFTDVTLSAEQLIASGARR